MNTVGYAPDCIRARGNWTANWFWIRGSKGSFPVYFVPVRPFVLPWPDTPLARRIARLLFVYPQGSLPGLVAEELLVASRHLPFAKADLRKPFSEVVGATDATPGSGGACEARA